ncbi:sodium- and chloride-dependent neutral and basic amino acid transporter B(0+)-like [Scyliorhinus canicula]|uniref:sodium- and chloride-dependent neutral and basic amino acid transporter B(0+)-like n=1 Tax=Scyliorhinus canicula TaxID=7830 RepID=UPI0018F6B840|nr:sodium- and chloride-dependent neutral and basic amino acid transporter B(0+)-like [Scyliorhinus canicula]
MFKKLLSYLPHREEIVHPEKHSSDSSELNNVSVAMRDVWNSQTDYLMSMIGYAVGLGNIWRFPYLAYKNGGGGFVLTYITMLTLTGLPMFFLECSLGQFSSSGPVLVWKAVPILQGVGVTMVFVSAFVALYYNCIIGYSVYYFFASFQYPLPWSECFDWWGADETCSGKMKDLSCNFTLADGSVQVGSGEICRNGTPVYVTQQSPSEHYWVKAVLRRTHSIDETGELVWYLALCLLLAWLITALALYHGIRSSGKVLYFTATCPYLLILMLFVRGATLEGAKNGIEYYIGSQSDFSKLAHAEVWKDAATQIFYSIAVALGAITALSSYNRFHNDCYRDAIVISVVNCGTSVFAGFAIFAILGHMAHVQDKSVREIVESGVGLVFIAYPDALGLLPVSSFWAVMFFLMLITLGIDSQFAMMETIITSLTDAWPNFMQAKFNYLVIILCLSFYTIGLIFATQAGIYWVQLLDHFSTGLTLLITAALELFGIIFIYGGNRFILDIEMMIGKKSWIFWLWWRICWFFISPCLILGILIWSSATFVPPQYGKFEYPIWAILFGWGIFFFCVIWIPILAITKIVQAQGSNLYEKFIASCRPAPDWGPLLKVNRGERYKNQIE